MKRKLQEPQVLRNLIQKNNRKAKNIPALRFPEFSGGVGREKAGSSPQFRGIGKLYWAVGDSEWSWS